MTPDLNIQSEWDLPQGSRGSTQENPGFVGPTASVEIDIEITIEDESLIEATVLTEKGVIAFTEQSVALFNWNGERQWRYKPTGSILTCGRFESLIVVVIPSKIVGLDHTDGSESWSTPAEDVTTETDEPDPTFTAYLTGSEREPTEDGSTMQIACVGTRDKTGVVAIDPATGSVVDAHIHEGTGEIESNPTYDAENEVVALPFSNSLVGLDANTFEVEFEVFAPVRGVSTFDGISVTYVEQGYITGIDTTREQAYEPSDEFPVDSRVLWEYHIDDEDTFEPQDTPCRIDDQIIFPVPSGIKALSIETGDILENPRLGKLVDIASSENNIYAIGIGNIIYHLDDSGELISEYLLPHSNGDQRWDSIALGRENIVLSSESTVAIASGQNGEQSEEDT